MRQFKISDLKTGMVVEFKNGKKAVIVGEVAVNEDTCIPIRSFYDNLQYRYPEYNIVKIYGTKEFIPLDNMLSDENLNLVCNQLEAMREDFRKFIDDVSITEK